MSQRFYAKPILTILVVNVLFITVAPRIWFEVLAGIYRILSPAVGRTVVIYVEAALTVVAGAAWLYVWRESFRRLYRKASANVSKGN
ncbi:MAG TPA: hypothetical protein VEG31_02315 [Thermoproteota archaeon]|nr:hypothetical protein [Thermoproteota archaeon]